MVVGCPTAEIGKVCERIGGERLLYGREVEVTRRLVAL